MKTASLPRTLANVSSHTSALDFVNNPANRRELCAAGRIPYRGEDAFQDAVTYLLEHPYIPQMGAFSTHWYNCCRSGKSTDRANSRENGITPSMGGILSLDGFKSRGSDGSTDNAKSAYLGRFDPAPAEEREATNARIRGVWSKLSIRQKKYLVGKAKGMTNAELAQKFGISAGSVAQIAEYIRAAAGVGQVTR